MYDYEATGYCPRDNRLELTWQLKRLA